jgi:glycosyltransferase involved in cell wall biosynthesis
VKYAAEAPLAAQTLGSPVHVIPNGVPLDRWPPPGRSGSSGSGRLVLGTSARISPQKRLEQLLEALRIAQPKLPEHVLRIAGGVERGAESYASSLRDLAEGLDVEWVGELRDTVPFLDGLDVFVLVAEPAGCPNASLEAMARGLPVVATAVGGMSEQVVDGVTGRLAPRADIETLADAIIDACGDRRRLERWGAASRLKAETQFGVGRMVANYSCLFFGEGLDSRGQVEVLNSGSLREPRREA